PLCNSEEKARLIEAATANHHVRLNESQRGALEAILTSQDRIIGLQGYAGTGKTTTLAVLKTAAEGSGYEVRGYAPTTKAAKQLNESGIEAVTLQKFLRSRNYAE
ncbi:MAG: AAA family ATPase, partial [Pyrinomonadaceae bacterium]